MQIDQADDAGDIERLEHYVAQLFSRRPAYYPLHKTINDALLHCIAVKKVKVKKGIAVCSCRQACHHRYGNSHAIWDHTVLLATRQR